MEQQLAKRSEVKARKRTIRRISRATPAGIVEPAISRGFACPHEPLDERFLETVVVEYARRFTELFLSQSRRELGTDCRSLAQFLHGCLKRPLSFDAMWDISLGQARRAVLDGDLSSRRRHAAALGLRFMEHGCTGEWEMELDAPTRFRWDRWLLPAGQRLKVAAAESSVAIQITRARSVKRVSLSQSERGWDARGAEALPVARRDGQRYVVIPGAATGTFALGEIRFLRSGELKAATRALLRALDLLACHAPLFIPWIGRVLRGVVPVEATPGLIQSGSDEDHPGLVYMSTRCRPPALAEMLVHEATHQYYYLLARLGALEDGSDSTLYFSPIKGRGRPIGMILLAYHAFANVLLFYRLCRRTRLKDAGYCRENEKRLAPQLHQLEAALLRSRALTPLGDALWQPLAARIDRV